MSSVVGRHIRWLHDTIQNTCTRIRSLQSKDHARSEDKQQIIRELEDMRRRNKRQSSSFDDWEEVLWLHGIAVVAPNGANIPVLDICLGFENYELQNLDTTTYNYHAYNTQWDKVIGEKGFARLPLDEFQNEPVIDGLPASIWLECVEPAISILIAIGVLRRRKGNLTAKRNEHLNDSGHNQHGDFHVGPRPVFTLPRRSIIRLDTRCAARASVTNRQEFNEIINELPVQDFMTNPQPTRNPRRHRNRQLYRMPQSHCHHEGILHVDPISIDLSVDVPVTASSVCTCDCDQSNRISY